MLMKLLKLVLLLAVLFVAVVGGYIAFYMWRHNEFAEPTYDTLAPQLPELPLEPRVLVFSKTNGFRHIEAIPAANAMFAEFASQEGWSIFFTENAAVHNTGALSQFDLVIWNNVSGDVLTEKQVQEYDVLRGYSDSPSDSEGDLEVDHSGMTHG